MPRSIPHNYALWVDFDNDDVWIGTSKGVGWAVGSGYYKGLKKRPVHAEAVAPMKSKEK